MQINKIRGRLAIVPNEVPHQNVNYVVVDWNCFAKSGHGASRSEAATVTAILINGQHFLRADPFSA
jgi:hypothetical protein